jgi:hypothetical protein
MIDRRPDSDDAALRADLDAWFQGEVRQAAADLRRAPLRPSRARVVPGRGAATPAVAAALLVILVVAGISRLPAFGGPGVEPTGDGTPTAPTTEPSASAPGSSEPLPSASAPPLAIGGRFDDGIPMSIDGESVLRPGAVERRAPVGDAPFLVGGWTYDFQAVFYSCAIILGTPPPFGPHCGNPFLADTALVFGEGPRVMLAGWTSELGGGPFVVRVHRHDAQAAGCEPELREACESMAVVEGVVWAGDEVTTAEPFSPIAVFDRLIGADPNLYQANLTAVPGTIVYPDDVIGTQPRPFACPPPVPDLAWSVEGSGLTMVLVFPTTAAREATDQDFTATGYRGDGCFVTTDSTFMHEWIAVANVMVAVQIDVDGATPAQAKLVDDVRASLEVAPLSACPSCQPIP